MRRLSQHWAFIAAFMAGATLRMLAWLAYQPALFYSDSANYLHNTGRIPGTAWHPPGYPVFLDLLLIGHHLAVVTAVQHLLVLGDAMVIYRVLLRLGAPRPVATLATLPVLLDAFQIQIEQYIMSEALFETVLVAAIAIALRGLSEPKLSGRRAAAVAGLLSIGALIRLDAIALLLPLAGWLIWSQVREFRRSDAKAWRPIGAAAAAFLLPLLILASLRATGGNGVSVTGDTAIWLYGRVAPFANCDADGIPVSERALCPTQPTDARPGPTYFENAATSPMRIYLAAHPHGQPLIEAFAKRVAVHQPGDYLAAVGNGFLTQFRPTHAQTAGDPDVTPWLFRLTLKPVDPSKPQAQAMVDEYGTGQARLNLSLARFLRGYQRYVYAPGPLLAVLLLGSLAVLVVRRRQPLAPVLLFVTSAGVITVLFSTATVVFSWRYVLPTLILYPVAAAIAWLLWRRPQQVVSTVQSLAVEPVVATTR